MATEIKVAVASRDRRRALAFVRYHVRRKYGGIPPPSQVLIFAEERGRVRGTIALDFSDGGREFHLESIYRFDPERTPWSFDRSRMAQFSKWWTTRPGMGIYLMYAAHRHALENGRQFGLVEVKPPIVDRVGEFGMKLIEIPGAELRTQGISSRGEGYYAALPPPQLYMFDVAANERALRHYLER